MTRLLIGTRVRLRGTAILGTIFAVPYTFHGEHRCGVTWDCAPARRASMAVSELALVEPSPPPVPPEARPVAVGAMAGGGR